MWQQRVIERERRGERGGRERVRGVFVGTLGCLLKATTDDATFPLPTLIHDQTPNKSCRFVLTQT